MCIDVNFKDYWIVGGSWMFTMIARPPSRRERRFMPMVAAAWEELSKIHEKNVQGTAQRDREVKRSGRV